MRKSTVTITPYQFQMLRRTKTTKEIAEMSGCTVRALQIWCNRNCIDIKRIADWEIEEEINIKTPKEIAYEYNIGVNAIYYRLKKLNINVKQRGGK